MTNVGKIVTSPRDPRPTYIAKTRIKSQIIYAMVGNVVLKPFKSSKFTLVDFITMIMRGNKENQSGKYEPGALAQFLGLHFPHHLQGSPCTSWSSQSANLLDHIKKFQQ